MHSVSFTNFRPTPTDAEKEKVARRLQAAYVGERGITLTAREVLALTTGIKDRERKIVSLESQVSAAQQEANSNEP